MVPFWPQKTTIYEKPNDRRGTARRTASVEISSTAAQLYKQIRFGEACSK